jgi:hypothetical protein
MISKQYFVVRPTELGLRRFQELGLIQEEDVVTPRVWAQPFDLRTTIDVPSRRWVIDVVQLQAIAFVLSQLHDLGVNVLENEAVDMLRMYWTVEWLDGGLVDSEEIDVVPSIVQKLQHGTNDSRVSDELEKLLARMT